MRYHLLIWTFLLSLLPQAAMAVEEPKFKLLEKSAPFELRQYPSLIVAEVLVEGDLDEASGKGFRLLADFIFGNNRAPAGASEKIAMTAPVTVEPLHTKIAMTAPVTVQPESGRWQVRFVMPGQYTLATLPVPNNPQVRIREVPGRKVAVITFSGLAGESKTAQKTEELMSWVASKQLKPAGTPELARYNPPWTLPFLRRNEVMVEYE
jgi:hypothetical protein